MKGNPILTKTPAPNDSGLPALLAHVRDMQTKATRLLGLLEVIGFIENEEACLNGRVALTEIAIELAGKLNLGLDSVSLPELAL